MATMTIGPDVDGGLTGAAAVLTFAAPGMALGTVTDTLIRISSPTVSYVIRGEGLVTSVVGGFPFGTAGTVTSIRALNGDDPVLTISDLDWDWSVLSNAITSEATGSNRSAFDALLFGETYTYQGNNNADRLAVGVMTNEGIPVSFGGHDTYLFRGGNDNFALGAGDDTARGGAGRDSLHGEDGSDRIFGGGGSDMLTGGAGNDSLIGNGGSDELFGGGDNDRMSGGGGGDDLNGGDGDDTMAGGGGGDTFFGMTGNDTMTGNAGGDVFDFVATDGGGFGGHDVITDFRLGQDSLLFGNVGEWSITSAGSADLVLTSTSGATITLDNRATGNLTIDDLI